MANLIESKYQLQINRYASLKSISEPIKRQPISELTKIQLQSRLDHLQDLWQRIERDHEAIYGIKWEIIKEHEYIQNNLYQKMYEEYDTQLVYIQRQMANLAANLHDGSMRVETSVLGGHHVTRARLPELELEIFDGTVTKWRAFSDMFWASVGKLDYSNVVKLQYLKRSVKGEPARLLAPFVITDENFMPAWDKLVARYENKRIIIETHLETLFTMKQLQQASAKGLFELTSTVIENLAALKVLGAPTDKWDLIIVHLATRCLDQDTCQAWALNQGANMVPSDLSEFIQFLEARAAAIDTMERHLHMKTSTPKAKSHATTSLATSSISKQQCSLYSEDHHLFRCPDFARKTAADRKDFIKRRQLCFNCLALHSTKECLSKGTCRNCKQRHNTLLHEAFCRSDQFKNKTTSQTTGSSSDTSPVVSNSFKN